MSTEPTIDATRVTKSITNLRFVPLTSGTYVADRRVYVAMLQDTDYGSWPIMTSLYRSQEPFSVPACRTAGTWWGIRIADCRFGGSVDIDECTGTVTRLKLWLTRWQLAALRFVRPDQFIQDLTS